MTEGLHQLTGEWSLLSSVALLAVAVLMLVVLATLVSRWHVNFWRRRLATPAPYAEVRSVRMPDGLGIELRRLPRDATEHAAAQSRPPVLLVHGIAANHRNVDPVPDHSLARYLAGRGRDVWLLTLRSALGRYRPFGDPRCTFDAMCQYDLPQAVDHVLQQTGASQVDVGGFSMGGMVLYASLGQTLAEAKVRRAVIIGSPGRVRPLGPLKWARWLPRGTTPTLPLRWLLSGLAFAYRLLPRFLHTWLYNPDNCSPEIARRCMVELFADVPGVLGAELVRWSYEGGELKMGGQRVLEHLAEVGVPVLFFAGGADRIAPPATVHEAYEAWGSHRPEVDKHYTLLSAAEGTSQDYGHGCLVFGRHADRDIFEPAAEFLS